MIARLLAIAVLVLMNGYFVSAEFALVRSRRTRLEAMAADGDRLARLALRATSNIPGLLSASQVGVTVASLGLGWVAEVAVARWFADAFGAIAPSIEIPVRLTVASAIALAAVSYLHIVFGELAPKSAALQHPEELARWLVPPLMLFAFVTRPFTILLSRSAALVLRAFGERGELEPEGSVHSPEELRLLVEQSQESGALEQQDAAMLDAVFDFAEKHAREVMTPRTEIVALESRATLDETLAVVGDRGFSRYPVYAGTIDNIVGILLTKDLLAVARVPPPKFTPATIMRPAHVVPGSREVEEVLADFKRLKEHMAIVLDEYGGTAGIVTMEDLLEEIVGEILDEYDESVPPPAQMAAGELLVPGNMNIGEVNTRYELTVPESEYTTIGGFVFGALGRLPAAGDRLTAGGATITVQAMDGRRVEMLAIEKIPAPEPQAEAAPPAT